MKAPIAITTVSWIRTRQEGKVVLATIRYLNKLNVPIICVDGNSSFEDKKAIRQFSNIIFFEDYGGLTNQLILSHKEAAKRADYLFYLHTDKLDLAKNAAQKMIDYYNNLNNKGILVPTRAKKSLNTYPSYQRHQEEFLNFFMSEYIGIKKDYYTGPKIYPSTLVKYLDQLEKDIGWGFEAYFYVIAKRLGLPFDFFPVTMTSPRDIGDEETIKLYRLKITQWQIEGFLEGQKIKL
jgi:hypothetical protein